MTAGKKLNDVELKMVAGGTGTACLEDNDPNESIWQIGDVVEMYGLFGETSQKTILDKRFVLGYWEYLVEIYATKTWLTAKSFQAPNQTWEIIF